MPPIETASNASRTRQVLSSLPPIFSVYLHEGLSVVALSMKHSTMYNKVIHRCKGVTDTLKRLWRRDAVESHACEKRMETNAAQSSLKGPGISISLTIVRESGYTSQEAENIWQPRDGEGRNTRSKKITHIPVDEPGPEPEPPAPKGPTLIVGSKAIISANISMIGFGTVLS